MADTTTQTYVTREPEWMEAYRRANLEDVKALTSKAPEKLPTYEVAGMSPEQLRAIGMASSGIGAYQPYLSQASNLYGSAKDQYGQMSGYASGALNAAQGGQNAAQDYLSRADQGYGGMTSSTKAGMNAAQPYLYGAASGYGEAGGYGSAATGLGIAGAQGYNPNDVTSFMNPYQQQVTQNTLSEMNRQAAIQNQGTAAQAVRAGAFGGSRFGVQQAEQAKNLATAQGNVIAQDYSQNYNQAQLAAMNAFQNQQARLQNAGQMSLGAGNLANQSASGLASLGQQQFGMGSTLGSMYGQQAAGLTNLGQQQYNMGMGVAQTGLNAGNLQGQAGSGLASLGSAQANLGQQATSLGQADTSFLYNMSANLQGQNQKLQDAQRLNQTMINAEPYTRMSYYQDALNKTPSGQMGMTQTTQPSASPFSQIAGVSVAGLGAYGAYQNANRA